MRVRLAYGRGGLTIDVPRERTTVIEPVQAPALDDAAAALTAALRRPVAGRPLRELAKQGQTVAISVCDVTRAQPRREMVGAVLDELDGLIRPEDVAILIATGTHRANTPAELQAMLGDDILGSCRVINHDARDDSWLVDLGETGNGVPTRLCRHWLEADLRITTGFVEPHFFAGFSGGPKMVAPGLAGLDTVLTLHDAARVGDPRSTWGIVDDNPMHTDIRAIAARPEARPHFSMDVLLDRQQRITHVFAGALFEMHRRACATAKPIAMRETSHRFEVVVTTNSGYPLDQNLYQAVKGMSAAAQVVADGGTILCAAECSDGIPDHGRYAELLGRGGSPEELLQQIEARKEAEPDQWQVQVQALIQRRARVLVKADGLSGEQLAAAHFEPAPDLDAALAECVAARPDARICVLPEGPQTIPYVEG
ncbi:MAG: nickel-dependent lactate racemase [Holophagales bacterium]|nr:nickel-dependent lactate racemase [Holophagales bacterium]MYD21564.1 nickel-dependent lactate racemase [Holophagales bacterium]MYI31768.1 nickel-dependent lactate racemase [Holophagales bacterium]